MWLPPAGAPVPHRRATQFQRSWTRPSYATIRRMAADDRRLITERLRSVYLFRTPREIDFDKLAGLFELVRYPAGSASSSRGPRRALLHHRPGPGRDHPAHERHRDLSARPRGARAARLSSAPPPAPRPTRGRGSARPPPGQRARAGVDPAGPPRAFRSPARLPARAGPGRLAAAARPRPSARRPYCGPAIAFGEAALMRGERR
jgi:hypothetical protein